MISMKHFLSLYHVTIVPGDILYIGYPFTSTYDNTGIKVDHFPLNLQVISVVYY